MIEKSKVIQRIKSQIAVCDEVDSDWCTLTVGTCKRILELIDEAKIPDDVRIVRCGDCKHYEVWRGADPVHGACEMHHMVHNPEWFCADGVRKRKPRKRSI